MVGDSRVCVEPLIDGTNRGLQCIFGDMPPVHAYLLRLDASAPLTPRPADAIDVDPRVGTALICELPALADILRPSAGWEVRSGAVRRASPAAG